MITGFETKIADRCGVNAAIIATYLWELQDGMHGERESTTRFDYFWVRCSQVMMTAELSFMSIHMVKDAVAVLKDENIIKTADLNENRFDHTNWYTFTEYGQKLLEGDGVQ